MKFSFRSNSKAAMKECDKKHTDLADERDDSSVGVHAGTRCVHQFHFPIIFEDSVSLFQPTDLKFKHLFARLEMGKKVRQRVQWELDRVWNGSRGVPEKQDDPRRSSWIAFWIVFWIACWIAHSDLHYLRTGKSTRYPSHLLSRASHVKRIVPHHPSVRSFEFSGARS